MKKIVVLFFVALMSAAIVSAGFDQYGYNDKARIFVGTGSSWCLAKDQPANCQGIWSPDKLVMKWNAEWDKGNDEGWTDTPYDAWINNQWNGMCDGCSGEVWHYKIAWDVGCATARVPTNAGGYCIWGQFVVLMDQGTSDGVHYWFAHTLPNGYGWY